MINHYLFFVMVLLIPPRIVVVVRRLQMLTWFVLVQDKAALRSSSYFLIRLRKYELSQTMLYYGQPRGEQCCVDAFLLPFSWEQQQQCDTSIQHKWWNSTELSRIKNNWFLKQMICSRQLLPASKFKLQKLTLIARDINEMLLVACRMPIFARSIKSSILYCTYGDSCSWDRGSSVSFGHVLFVSRNICILSHSENFQRFQRRYGCLFADYACAIFVYTRTGSSVTTCHHSTCH